MKATLTAKQHYWLDQVKAAESSGLSYKAYANQAQIDLKSLYNWKSQFIQKSLLPDSKVKPFVKVKAVASRSLEKAVITPKPEPIQVLLPNGIQLTLDQLSKENVNVLLSL